MSPRTGLDGPPPQGYSAAALYNQGNAEARAGRPAFAVLNYARAQLLAPWDGDIRANLQTVQHSVGVPDRTQDWLQEHARFASPNTVYWCGCVGLLMIAAALLSQRLSARRPWLAVPGALGLVLVIMSAGDMLATHALLQQAVVMRPAPARASPVSASDPLFTLAAAELVRVEERHLNFALVRDARGRQGWTADSDLVPVVPPDVPR